MELALALTLRVYYVVPDSVLIEIISHRKRLLTGTTDVRMRSAPLGGASLLSSKSTVGRPFAYVASFWTFSSTSRVGNSSNSVRPSQFRPARPFPFSLSSDLAARALLPIGLSLLSGRSRRVVTSGAFRQSKRSPAGRDRT